MSEWVTHSAELARKSLERLTDALNNPVQSKSSAFRVWVIADTLSEVTQGLIPTDDWKVIDLIRKEARKQAGDVERRE